MLWAVPIYFDLSAGASNSVYFCVEFGIYYTDIPFIVLNLKSMYMVYDSKRGNNLYKICFLGYQLLNNNSHFARIR